MTDKRNAENAASLAQSTKRVKRSRHASLGTRDAATKNLPFGAQALDKHAFEKFRPLFASYLDIQKQISLDEIDEKELKGRWRRFVGKWNRGELAEGWYDPSRLRKATTVHYASEDTPSGKPVPIVGSGLSSGSNDEDDFGPPLPNFLRGQQGNHRRAGLAIPGMQDLELKREFAEEQAKGTRNALRVERRAQKALEKDRMEELAPRAAPGSKERQLEKKKELGSSNKAFAVAKEGGDMAEMPEQDLMGGEEDDIASLKRRKSEAERQKSERELRREEISRAKREEREQRQRDFREKEDRTMEHFIELAKRRFG